MGEGIPESLFALNCAREYQDPSELNLNQINLRGDNFATLITGRPAIDFRKNLALANKEFSRSLLDKKIMIGSMSDLL
jgi:hypothetical protein